MNKIKDVLDRNVTMETKSKPCSMASLRLDTPYFGNIKLSQRPFDQELDKIGLREDDFTRIFRIKTAG